MKASAAICYGTSLVFYQEAKYCYMPWCSTQTVQPEYPTTPNETFYPIYELKSWISNLISTSNRFALSQGHIDMHTNDK